VGALAYMAGAWAVPQVVDALGERWGLTPASGRALDTTTNSLPPSSSRSSKQPDSPRGGSPLKPFRTHPMDNQAGRAYLGKVRVGLTAA
jgi:hypothetical protein